MAEIERYKGPLSYSEAKRPRLRPDPHGHWVKYRDHLTALADELVEWAEDFEQPFRSGCTCELCERGEATKRRMAARLRRRATEIKQGES